MRKLHVGLGDRAYDILIEEGLLGGVGEEIRQRRIAKRFAVVADDLVSGLLGHKLMVSLAAAGLDAVLVTFPRGESSKNLATVAVLASKLAQLGMDRKDGLIALGGGVTGDITGFLAAIYMRGVPFVQIPTTLLSQVDSSVGGKTGVDIPEGKNLVGVFYQPRCVCIDSQVLRTLPEDELLSGLAEVIKYGVIHDADFFAFLEEKRELVLRRDLETLAEVIARCCAIKAEIVAADERESDLRRILNFGHTIGHAVEGASGYALSHGVSVGMGMVAAAELAACKGLLSRAEADRIRHLISAYGLPVSIPEYLDRNRMKEYLKTDKKTVAGRPFFVLPTAVGKVLITDDVPEDLIDMVLHAKN